jgi:hypothetical protein
MDSISIFLYACIIALIIHYVLSQFNLVHRSKYLDDDLNEDEHISNYYLDNYLHMDKLQKDKIFIHIPFEYNSRKAFDFSTRNSTELNLPLCEMCIKSVIKHCSSQYDIVIYTNYNCKYIINEEDNGDLCNIKNPERLSGVDLYQWENYCKARILKKYGGIVMEPMFLFFKQPPRHVLKPSRFTISTFANEGRSVSEHKIIPSTSNLIGSPKNDDNLNLYCEYLKNKCIHHYSEDHKYFDKSYEQLSLLPSFCPKMIGVMDSQDNIIYAAHLLQDNNINLHYDAFCVFIDIDYLKKYRKYGYTLTMNEKQILESNSFLAKLIKNYK